VNGIEDEADFASFDSTGSPHKLPSPAEPTDVVGGPAFGRVLRPAGLAFPETAEATEVHDWTVRRYTAPAPDQRAYDYIIDRSKQLWWAPRPTPRPRSQNLSHPAGFSGRWGPRVTNDPNTRRCGMKCPDFALLLLEAEAKNVNSP
jgi:hypothetical protein